MTRKLEKNALLTEQFDKYYPCGHTNFKVPIETTSTHIFQARAQGSKFWDVDGNEYIDYMAGMGPGILGHRHPEYIESLQSYLDSLSVCIGSGTIYSEDDIAVAEKIVRHIPCAERVKFCVTGTDAVQMAIRLSRAYTGRRYFVRFSGHYHGWLDNVFGGLLDPAPEGKPFALTGDKNDYSHSAGQSLEANQEGFLLPWNDDEALENTLEKYGNEIAVIHFEALVGNNKIQYPRPGFLEKIRALCDRYGIVMSIDEVITGFRVGLGGAQGMFGVTPDICTLGKALGGGMPISAVAGKAAILDQLKDGTVLGPGTFNGIPFCMRAARTTLDILERDNGAAFREIDRVQQPLMAGLAEIAGRHGIPMRVQGVTGILLMLFGVDPDTEQYTEADAVGFDFEMSSRFWRNIMEEGIAIHNGGRWYPTLSHTDDDTARALEAADKAMANL